MLLAVCTLMGSFLAHSLWRQWQWIDLRERERLSAQVDVMATNLERQLNAINQVLESLIVEQVDWAARVDGPEQANRHLQAFRQAMPGVLTLFMLNPEGVVFASSRNEIVGRGFGQREYFQTAQQHPDVGTLYVGVPFVSAAPAYTMALSRILPGTRGEFSGLLVATVNPEETRILLESVRYAPDMWTSIAHGDGTMFMMQPDRPGMSGRRLDRPGTLFMRHLQTGQEKSLFSGTVLVTGEQNMTAIRTLNASALKMDKPLVLAASRDMAAIFASWWQSLWVQGGLFGLLVLVVVSGLLIAQRQRRRAAVEHAALDAKLQAKAEEFQHFFAMALDLFCIADTQGYFRKLNPAWETVLGYSLEELERARFQEFVHPDDQAATRAAMGELGAGKPVVRFVNRYRTANGDYRFIEWHAAPSDGGLIYAAARDVSERVASEEALRLGRERLTGIIEGTHVGTWEWKVQTGELILNERWAEIIGYTLDELQPVSINTWVGFTHPDDFAESQRQLQACFRRVLEFYECEVRMRHRNGSWVWILDRGKVVEWSQEGAPLLMLGTHQDITARKQNEALLVEARHLAEAANRAKSAFLANMSYEIRTPMNAVLGLTQLVLDSELQPEQREMLDMVHASAKSLLGILNDILDYSKVESGRLELEQHPLNLRQLLQNFVSLFTNQLTGKNLTLKLHVAPDVPPLLIGDELRLSQVVGNLLSNAIKFTEKGGIDVHVEVAARGEAQVTLRFCVRDTGIGLAREQLDRLFQAFSQADPSITRKYGGTGLGLTISHRLVSLMGGDLTVSSVPGQGTAFSFTVILGLPRDNEPSGAVTHASTANLRFDGISVLLVEDNFFNAQVAEKFLSRRGACVTLARDGQEGVDWVRRQRFDAVLMDLHMPKMDGFEATRQIRAEFAGLEIPIIAMTAAVMPEDRLRCAEVGMSDFVAKPMDSEDLLRCLARWVKPRESIETTAADEHASVFDSLRSMPGFNLVDALDRLGQDRALLRQLLLGFAADQADVREKLAHWIQLGDRGAAANLLHALKGAAGNLGASELAIVTERLERDVRAGAPLDSLAEFEAVLATTLSSIRTFCATASPVRICGEEITALSTTLMALRPYLIERELVPPEIVDNLSRLSADPACASSAVLQRLVQQITLFDYEAALSTIESLSPAEN